MNVSAKDRRGVVMLSTPSSPHSHAYSRHFIQLDRSPATMLNATSACERRSRCGSHFQISCQGTRGAVGQDSGGGGYSMWDECMRYGVEECDGCVCVLFALCTWIRVLMGCVSLKSTLVAMDQHRFVVVRARGWSMRMRRRLTMRTAGKARF